MNKPVALDHNLVHNANHLWRKIIKGIDASHAMGTDIWVYEMNVQYANRFLNEAKLDKYRLCKRRAKEAEKKLKRSSGSVY